MHGFGWPDVILAVVFLLYSVAAVGFVTKGRKPHPR
jgi:hypothetical protein